MSKPETDLIMRTSNRFGHYLGLFLIVTLLPLSSLFAQEKKLDLKPFFDLATEEIPDQSKTKSVKKTKPPNEGFNTTLHNITEESTNRPKARFVSSKSYLENSLKIQAGYFKEKKNVFNLVHKIKKNHDWSVYIKTENKNGTDYYRVLILDINSTRTANQILGQLKAEGITAMIK